MDYDRWLEGAYDLNPTGNNPHAPECEGDGGPDCECPICAPDDDEGPDPDDLRDREFDRRLDSFG